MSSSPSPTLVRSRTRVTKNLAALKRVTTRKIWGWSSKGWKARSGWQHSLADDAGQSSQDQWKKPASRGKWTEFFNVVEELGTLLKDKKGTWVKRSKESMERETEVLVVADEFKTTGKAYVNT